MISRRPGESKEPTGDHRPADAARFDPRGGIEFDMPPEVYPRVAQSQPQIRRGVLEMSVADFQAIMGLRTGERFVAIEHAPARGVLRVTVEGGWLPLVASGSEAPIVDQA